MPEEGLKDNEGGHHPRHSSGRGGGQRPRARRCCPRCGSDEVRRSHRRGLVELLILPIFLRRPYYCNRCMRRFYSFVGG